MWKCIFDAVTNRGTGFNREPMEGEFAKDIPPAECGWFNAHPERYWMDGGPSGQFKEWAGWAAEQTAKELADAKAFMVSSIVQREDAESWKPILYKGHQMKATEAIAKTIDRFRSLADETPVPMLDGHWNDFYETPVPMTMGELRALADLIYDRGMYNYGVRIYHSAAVEALTTKEEVEAYDFSTNWQ